MDELGATTVGIFCITQENRKAPWILFEAGALAKGQSKAAVCTLLVDLTPADIEPPLNQFNHTLPQQRDSMFQLVHTLNLKLADRRLDDSTLERVFETYWPQFEKAFKTALSTTEPDPSKQEPARTERNMIAEVLGSVRTLANQVAGLESELRNVTKRNSAISGISADSGKRLDDVVNEILAGKHGPFPYAYSTPELASGFSAYPIEQPISPVVPDLSGKPAPRRKK